MESQNGRTGGACALRSAVRADSHLLDGQSSALSEFLRGRVVDVHGLVEVRQPTETLNAHVAHIGRKVSVQRCGEIELLGVSVDHAHIAHKLVGLERHCERGGEAVIKHGARVLVVLSRHVHGEWSWLGVGGAGQKAGGKAGTKSSSRQCIVAGKCQRARMPSRAPSRSRTRAFALALTLACSPASMLARVLAP